MPKSTPRTITAVFQVKSSFTGSWVDTADIEIAEIKNALWKFQLNLRLSTITGNSEH